MATLTANKAAVGVMPKGLRAGLVAVTSTYSVAASLSVGDVIQMIKVPANATPTNVGIWVNSGVATVTAGDGISTARYNSGYSASSAAPLLPINTQYVPYTYSADDTIDVVVTAVVTGTAVGAITMVAIFSMDT